MYHDVVSNFNVHLTKNFDTELQALMDADDGQIQEIMIEQLNAHRKSLPYT